MVREAIEQGKQVFFCEVCGYGYSDRQTAGECEHYCSKYDSCSLAITSKAVRKPMLE